IEGKRVVLVNHLSPLVRWITECNRNEAGVFFDTAALRLREPELPEGVYVYRIERWLFRGLRKRESLNYALMHLQSEEPAPADDAERVVKKLLDGGEDWLHR